MQRFFAAIILILIAMLAICMLLLIVAAGWLLVLDGESRNRLVTEVGVNPAWKEPRFVLVQTGIPLVWLGCVIVCFLKGKSGSAVIGIVAGVAQEIGLPPIGGYYIFDHILDGGGRFIVNDSMGCTSVVVEFDRRPPIEAVFQVFERDLPLSLPKPLPPTVFIGHGKDSQWRDLKDHLQDQQGVDIIAYEIGPRAGASVKEVLEQMLEEASFALLVLTGEDLHVDGDRHARENVIHELGLFQGRLGFTRALAMVEEGVREFSNILGVNQVRFPKGRIRETFGDVVAILRREFPQLFS